MEKALAQVDIKGEKLRPDERGLVLSTLVSRSAAPNATTITDNRSLAGTSLRAMMLFFDRIDLPRGVNDMLYKGDVAGKGKGRSGDEQYLIDSGFMTRSFRMPEPSEVEGLDFDRGMLDGVDVFLEREIAEPGQWAIAPPEDKRLISSMEEGDAPRSLSLCLLDALPLPKADIPLEDILRFREEYSDERLRLRIEIEKFRERIIEAGDSAAAAQSCLTEVRASSKDFVKSFDSAGFSYTRKDFEFDISLGIGAAGLVVADAISAGFASLGFAAIRFGSAAFERESSSPYQYVGLMHKQLRS